jgi:hypothetical protein
MDQKAGCRQEKSRLKDIGKFPMKAKVEISMG